MRSNNKKQLRGNLNRIQLADNLARSQELMKLASNSQNFGSGYAGGFGLLAQGLVAGVGAYKQYKLKQEIAQQEAQDIEKFSNFANSQGDTDVASIAEQLTPETREAYYIQKTMPQLSKGYSNKMPASVQEYEYYKNLNPTEQQKFLKYGNKMHGNKMPASVQEYEYSKNLNPTEQEKFLNIIDAEPKLKNKVDEEIIKKTRESASFANDSLRNLESIQEALFDSEGNPKIKTGKIQKYGQQIGQYLPFVESGRFQEINAKTTELGLNISSMLKGQTSDRDVSRSLESVAGFDKEPNANKKILTDKKAAIKVVAEMPKFTTNWIQSYGSTLNPNESGQSFDDAFLNWQSQAFKKYGGTKNTVKKYNPQTGRIE